MKQHAKQLNTREALFLLRRCDPAAEVRFDFCHTEPEGPDSWRGDYGDLAMGWREYNSNQQRTTVEALIKDLEATIGATFTGYKGGEYIMGEHTALWVDNRGEYTRTALVGVIDEGGTVYLETAYAP